MLSVRVAIFSLSVTFLCGAQGPAQGPPQGAAPAQAGSVPGSSTQTRRQLTPEERGDIYMARKMYREAIDVYKEAPESALKWDKIGIAWHQLGELKAARSAYERAVKLDGKFADGLNNLGTLDYAEKRYRSAIGRYRKAIAIAPDSATYWSNLGTAYFARGKFEDMAKCYAKALELDKDIFEQHGDAAGTRMQDRTVGDRARFHYEMARTYAKAGNNELALQYLRKALEEGFRDREKLRQAPEFAALRATAEFQELMKLEPRVL